MRWTLTSPDFTKLLAIPVIILAIATFSIVILIFSQIL